METKRCAKCKTINEDSFRYCKKCGTLLVSTTNGKPDALIKGKDTVTKQKQFAAEGSDIEQLGMSGNIFINPWQPFAGYGEREHHQTWLLDNLGAKAETLRNSLSDRFLERRIPDAEIARKRLSQKGLFAECRDYYIAKRKRISVGSLNFALWKGSLYLAGYLL